MGSNKQWNLGQAYDAGILIVARATHRLAEIKIALTLAVNRPEENRCSKTNGMDPDHAGNGFYRILLQSTRKEHVRDRKNILDHIKKFTRHYVAEALQMRQLGREAEETAIA